MAIFCFTFWPSEKLSSTLFVSNPVDSLSWKEFIFINAVGNSTGLTCTTSFQHYLLLLLFKVGGKNSHSKENQAFIGAWQGFPSMLCPWVRVHPAHWHILQACSNLWGKAMGVHSTGRHPEKTERKVHPRSCQRRHSSPGICSQDISVLAAPFALHCEKCGGAGRQLFGAGWRSSERLQFSESPLSKPEEWFQLRLCIESTWLFPENTTPGHIDPGIKRDLILPTLLPWRVQLQWL